MTRDEFEKLSRLVNAIALSSKLIVEAKPYSGNLGIELRVENGPLVTIMRQAPLSPTAMANIAFRLFDINRERELTWPEPLARFVAQHKLNIASRRSSQTARASASMPRKPQPPTQFPKSPQPKVQTNTAPREPVTILGGREEVAYPASPTFPQQASPATLLLPPNIPARESAAVGIASVFMTFDAAERESLLRSLSTPNNPRLNTMYTQLIEAAKKAGVELTIDQVVAGLRVFQAAPRNARRSLLMTARARKNVHNVHNEIQIMKARGILRRAMAKATRVGLD